MAGRARFVRRLAIRAAVITGVLFAIVVIAWAAAPLYLDRIYYRGAASDHYDGQRFFNPEDRAGPGGAPRGFGWKRIYALLTRERGPDWPESVAVTPTHPPAKVDGGAMRVTWIGHATVLVQTQGLNILTDPVWADTVGLFGRIGATRVRAPGVRMADLPKIDLILVSHNHYDHLDLTTIRTLWDRDRPMIVTGPGNDTLLRDHGIAAIARDWGQRVAIRPGIEVIVERVHHWSSRWGQDRNRALWSGFTLTLPGGNIFFAGDTGWGDGAWPAIAARHGPYRLAILPIGAFHPRAVFGEDHVDPQQAVEIFRTLNPRHAIGIHWGTFRLTEEAIDEPRRELDAALRAAKIAPGRFVTTEAGQGHMVR